MAARPTKQPGRSPWLLVALLSRWRGRAWTAAHLAEVQQLLRFAGLFLLTVAVPGLALGYFGLTSVRSESLRVESEIRDSGQRMIDAAWSQIQGFFEEFEESTRSRLAAGRSPLETPREISPALLVAFRLDHTGQLAAPFAPPSKDIPNEHSPLFSPGHREAISDGQANPSAEALQRLREATTNARGIYARGEAHYALGRALMSSGETQEAERVLLEVSEAYQNVREAHGFRLTDLARLKLAEHWLEKAPNKGVDALQALSQSLIEDRWVIGQGGEAAVAAHALELLEEHVSRDWLTTSRGRLAEKTRQSFWAHQLVEELTLLQLTAAGVPSEGTGFFYRVSDKVVWATTWWGSELFAFALDKEVLQSQLDSIVRGVSRGGGDAEVRVMNPLTEPPQDAFERQTLSPYLPGWSLISRPIDAEVVGALKTTRIRQQLAIILLSLLVIVVGGFLTIRMVRRELDVARMKADFAANVSHELRSPITQIRLKGESLQLGLAEDDAERSEHYDIIVRESERLSRLVDNVLDFSAIERGAKRYDRRPGNVGDTVRAAVESARYNMETRGLTMEVDLPDGLPIVFHDPEAIGQVVQNLVSNAAKYGAKGGWIGVKAWVASRSVDISISDRGIGIASDELPQIFEKFYRSDDPSARKEKGTGIGLTICQYIMTAHQGALSVRSAKGKGTTFTLHFPIRPPGESGL
ncbi:MAG: sensor histidine kinase [Myxococcota bacterium]|nr:sensor histidine kinase [Myxococcota bacterium]